MTFGIYQPAYGLYFGSIWSRLGGISMSFLSEFQRRKEQ